MHPNNSLARLTSSVLLLAAVSSVSGQTLPAPTVSPSPVVKFEYDAMGNPTKTVVAPGVSGLSLTSSITYDSLYRPSTIVDPKAGVVQIEFDGVDRPTKVIDPRALATIYPRNGLGDATGLISPDTGTSTYTVDAAGNLKTRTDSRGVLATYNYDALDRLISLVFSQSGRTSITQTWAYDQSGAGFSNGAGRLTSSNSPVSSSQYTYDPQGRVLSDTQRIKATTGANTSEISKTVGYAYDDAGNVTSIVYPSGRKLTIAYTGGLPVAVSLAATTSTTATNLVTGIQWEPFGSIKSLNWQMTTGSVAHEFVRDSNGRLIRYRIGPYVRDIAYDTADRITAYTHRNASTGATVPTLDQAFAYDELGRLKNVTTNIASWSIGYDANGNRASVTLNGVVSTYSTAASSNRLSSLTNPARSLGYDNAGNTSNGGTFSATYDLAGRMATLTRAGVTTTYAIDGFGKRVRKFSSTGSASTVLFVYDQQGHLLGEYNATGVPLREYVWLGDTPLAMFTPNGTNPPLVFYIHTDHLNTPQMVLNTAGQQRWSWLTEPFGTTAANSNPQSLGTFTFNLRFPGQYADAESGLFYNGFRDYDATIGRYTQSDPIGLAGGINTYAYVGGNPVDTIDPTGEFGIAGALWGAGVDLGFQLLMNGGKLKCVNWEDVGLAAAGGALTGGLLNGIGKIKKGVNNWNATSKWLRRSNGPGGPYAPQAGQQYHHWAIEQNSWVGKMVPDSIKNQPWNLNPIPKATHDLIHGNAPGGAQYGAFMRWWQGTPGWAKGMEMGLGTVVLAPGDQGDDCECQ